MAKMIGKREFIQHTSKYLKWVELHSDKELIITHQNKPALLVVKLKEKALKDLQGCAEVKIHGDINDHVLTGFDKW